MKPKTDSEEAATAPSSAVALLDVGSARAAAEWAAFVARSPQGNLFCHLPWLRAVCGQDFRVLVLRSGGALSAGWPLPFRQGEHGAEIWLPPLTQTLGVLYAPRGDAKGPARISAEIEAAEQLIAALPEVALADFQCSPAFTNWLPYHWAGFSQTTKYTYRIQLSLSDDAIFDGMAQPRRTAIRRAEKELSVAESADVSRYAALSARAAEKGKPRLADELLGRAAKAAGETGRARLLFATDAHGHDHAGALIVDDGRTAYYLHGAADPEFAKSGGPSLLLWHAIRASRPCSVFDFEGSMVASIEKFFRGFGGELTPYFRISKDNRSLWKRAAAKLGAKVRGK